MSRLVGLDVLVVCVVTPFDLALLMREWQHDLMQVTYMELRVSPTPPIDRCGSERIAREHLYLGDYLTLYRSVGEPLRWDQRLLMPEAALRALLEGNALSIYVLRDQQRKALGLCEFDRSEFPKIELKNFGLIPDAQRRGLGPWFLRIALFKEWNSGATRIWLHTDTWDHPAAIRIYERAGFGVYDVRREAPGTL
jgi:GNAT superfamily N-acetyltransferase